MANEKVKTDIDKDEFWNWKSNPSNMTNGINATDKALKEKVAVFSR